MTAFANRLSENKNLRDLLIWSDNPFDLRFVKDDFCRSLCNTSSINNIYLSNHTFEKLYTEQDKGAKLKALLALNKSTRNKRHVAIKKILLHYPHNIDMEPLFDLTLEEEDDRQDLKALPYVVSWFETAKEAIGHGHQVDYLGRKVYASTTENRKLSAIYQFVTAMPMLFIPASHTFDKKRKSID